MYKSVATGQHVLATQLSCSGQLSGWRVRGPVTIAWRHFSEPHFKYHSSSSYFLLLFFFLIYPLSSSSSSSSLLWRYRLVFFSS